MGTIVYNPLLKGGSPDVTSYADLPTVDRIHAVTIMGFAHAWDRRSLSRWTSDPVDPLGADRREDVLVEKRAVGLERAGGDLGPGVILEPDP